MQVFCFFVLRDGAFAHYWKDPENDRDWDIALLTRFLDGLIAMLPRTADEDEHSPGVASAA
jgi:hypothetical protein